LFIFIFYFCEINPSQNQKNQDTMKDRIAHIMRAKNLKASDFATMLGIQPSAVSHILAGRNNPSLEFVKKVKETFPEYNLDWIIFGTGPMTLSEPYKESFKESVKTATLFDDDLAEAAVATQAQASDPSPVSSALQAQTSNPQTYDTPLPQHSVLDNPAPELPFPSSSSDIKSIIVLYSDGTFDTYTPRS